MAKVYVIAELDFEGDQTSFLCPSLSSLADAVLFHIG